MPTPSSSPPQIPADGPAPRQPDASGTRRFTSAELLGDGLAMVIVHNGREYVLRVTQNGKLILTA